MVDNTDLNGEMRCRSPLSRVRADRSLQLLTLIAIVGLALRLYVVWRARVVLAPAGDAYDSPVYIALGYTWRNGSALDLDAPAAWYFPPGYPLFLGAIITVRDLLGGIGGLRVWVGAVQSVLAAGAIVVIGLLSRRIASGPRAGRWLGAFAALILAFWPGQVISSAVIMSEGVFTPLFVFGMALLLWDDEREPARLAVAGAVFGYLLTTRYSAIPLVAVAVAVVASRGDRGRPGRARAASVGVAWFLASLMVFLSPWLAFHAYTTGRLVPHESGAFNLCSGNHEGATGHFEPREPRCDPSRRSYEQIGEDARRWIMANLDQQPRLVSVRLADVFGAGDDYALAAYPSPASYELPMDGARVARAINTWWHVSRWLALAGLLVGIAICDNRFRWMAALSMALLLGPLMTTGTPRYHDPLVPFMAVCIASIPVAAGRSAMLARRRSPSSLAPKRPEPAPRDRL